MFGAEGVGIDVEVGLVKRGQGCGGIAGIADEAGRRGDIDFARHVVDGYAVDIIGGSGEFFVVKWWMVWSPSALTK